MTSQPVDFDISGQCDERFGPVRQAFTENFQGRGEVGASVCVMRNGEVLVDLYGGWCDEARSKPWQPNTITDFYSVGKALLSVLVLQLVDQGHVGLDDPIARVWPEFGAHGKGAATIRHALSHQAGVPAIREMLTNEDLFDWDRMTGAIANTEPWWVPGEAHAYHTNTFGHILGEVVHRVTGLMPGEAMRGLATQLDADVWFGVPVAEQERCADTVWAPSSPMPQFDFDALSGDLLMNALAHFNPPGYSSVGLVNTEQWRLAQIGSTSGHGSANGIARIYAALLEPGRLVSPGLMAEAVNPQSSGMCPILGHEMTFGLGFMKTTPERPFGPNPNSFGHFGSGGALGFADPDTGIAFGYVMNHVIPRWQSSRNRALMDSVYRSLGV